MVSPMRASATAVSAEPHKKHAPTSSGKFSLHFWQAFMVVGRSSTDPYGGEQGSGSCAKRGRGERGGNNLGKPSDFAKWGALNISSRAAANGHNVRAAGSSSRPAAGGPEGEARHVRYRFRDVLPGWAHRGHRTGPPGLSTSSLARIWPW